MIGSGVGALEAVVLWTEKVGNDADEVLGVFVVEHFNYFTGQRAL